MEQRIDDGLSPYRVYSREAWAALRDDTPVSYTHLTLPTIYSV